MAQQTIAGALIGNALGAYAKKPKVPELPRINLGVEQLKTVADNQAVRPSAEKLAMDVNKFQGEELNRMMAAAFPFFSSMLQKASTNTASLLAGQVPTDVSQRVQTSAAARALGGGYGGTGMGRNLTLRDLGRTSLDAQQQGLMNFGTLTKITEAVMPQPFQVSSMFISPLQRATWENEQNLQQFQRSWMENQIASQPSAYKQALAEGFNNLMATFASVGMMALGGGGGAMGMMGGSTKAGSGGGFWGGGGGPFGGGSSWG